MPLTSNVSCGAFSPIPTFPSVCILILSAAVSVPLTLVENVIIDVPVPSPPPDLRIKSPPSILFPFVEVDPAAIVKSLPAVVLVVASTFNVASAALSKARLPAVNVARFTLASLKSIVQPSAFNSISPAESKTIFPSAT